MSRERTLYDQLLALKAALHERKPEIVTALELERAVDALGAGMGTPPNDDVYTGLVQKALVLLLKQKLDADPAVNQRFVAATAVPLWNQLLMAARIRELAKAKIIKKGGRRQLRYDVSDLAKTFYGLQILTSVGLQRQRVLDKDELDKLQTACAKVKLTLPESIEPTTTERFFDDAAPAPVSKPKANTTAKEAT